MKLLWPTLVLGLVGCGDPSTGELTGQVTLRDDGDLAGLSIDLEGSTISRTETDAEGRYTFIGLPPGRYEVSTSLGLFSQEPSAKVTAFVESGVLNSAPDLVLTPAGAIRGKIVVSTGESPEGFRLQLVGTSSSTVTGPTGEFQLLRIPRGVYEIVAERADIGSARRGGIEVVPFGTADVGEIEVRPGDSADNNEHPQFTVDDIVVISNGTPEDSPVRPLPYPTTPGTVRRFDTIALEAPAEDPDGDALSYTWSASAGSLSDALTPTPTWQPDAASGNFATLSVTVRDGFGGIDRLSTDVAIVDVFADSASRLDDRVVHSYRIEGGPWQVDIVDLSTFERTPLFSTLGSAPRPLLLENHVVVQSGGELTSIALATGANMPLGFFPRGDSLVEPSVTRTRSSVVAISSVAPNEVVTINPSSGATAAAMTCAGNCLALASDGTTAVAGAFNMSGSYVFSFFQDTLGRTQSVVSLEVGRGFALDSGSLTFVTGDSGRGGRNGTALLPQMGTPQIAYSGFYTLLVWAFDGDTTYITEQEYRALRHPPFVRRLRGAQFLGDFPPDDDDWMGDAVFAAWDGLALIRRVASADWPTVTGGRSEIVLVRSDEAFR